MAGGEFEGVRRRVAASASALAEVVARPPLRAAELAFAASCSSEWVFTVGIGVVAFREGGAAAVGAVALARMLPAAVLSPSLTALADRGRRQRLLLVVSLVRAAALGAVAVALAGEAPVLGVYGFAVVASVVSNVFRPVHSALLPTLCATTRELASANVVRGMVDATGALLGPVIAGVLLAVGGPVGVFVAAALLCAGAAGALVAVPVDDERPAAPGRGALGRETIDGFAAVARDHDLRLVFGIGVAQVFVRGALTVFTVVAALELLDIGETGVATLTAAMGAGGLLGSLGVSLLVGSRRLGRWLATAAALWGAPIAVIGLAPSEPVAYLALGTVGIANALIDVPLFTLPVRFAQDAVLARAYGVFESLIALGVGLGSVAAPLLIDAVDLRAALVIVGGLLPALAALTWRRLADLDDRLGVRDDEIAILRRSPMFGVLSVPSIEFLASRANRVDVAAGVEVVSEGDAGAAYYVVAEGDAEVLGSSGLVLRRLGRGDGFGEISLLRDVQRTATVRSITALTMFEISRDEFLDAVGASRASRGVADELVAQHLANYRPAVRAG